jgi:hypothetical protein
MLCEFCKKEFSNKYNLINHQKNAKYCLSLRENQKDLINKTTYFECKFCYKNFNFRQNLTRHLLNCKEKINDEQNNDIENFVNKINELELDIIKYKNKNQKLKLKILELEQKINSQTQLRFEEVNEERKQLITKLYEKPTTINNVQNIQKNDNKKTNILMIAPIDDIEDPKVIQKIVEEKYQQKHLMEGVKGVANFTVENLLTTSDGKLRYLCTDPSRKIFIYKDKDNNMYKDIECEKLIDMIYIPVKEASKKIYNNIEDNTSQLKNELDFSLKKGQITKNSKEHNIQLEKIQLEEQREEYALNKNVEICNLNIDNKTKNNFIKSLSKPLNTFKSNQLKIEELSDSEDSDSYLEFDNESSDLLDSD